MAKTRHSVRMFGRKTARKRPKRDRIRITATGFGLEQDPRTLRYRTSVHDGRRERGRPTVALGEFRSSSLRRKVHIPTAVGAIKDRGRKKRDVRG